MSFVSSTILGFFFGFALGVGCALAVMYSIYSGGYRKGIEDSVRPEKPERYRKQLVRAMARMEREGPDGNGEPPGKGDAIK